MTFDEITETPENTAIANNTKPIIDIIDLKSRQFYDIIKMDTWYRSGDTVKYKGGDPDENELFLDTAC